MLMYPDMKSCNSCSNRAIEGGCPHYNWDKYGGVERDNCPEYKAVKCEICQKYTARVQYTPGGELCYRCAHAISRGIALDLIKAGVIDEKPLLIHGSQLSFPE